MASKNNLRKQSPPPRTWEVRLLRWNVREQSPLAVSRGRSKTPLVAQWTSKSFFSTDTLNVPELAVKWCTSPITPFVVYKIVKSILVEIGRE